MKINKNRFFFILIALITLSNLRFFRPIFFSDDLLKLIYYVFLAIMLAGVIHLRKKKYLVQSNFKGIIYLFIFNLFITLFVSEIAWGQSFMTTLVSSIPYLVVFFYFFLHKVRINVEGIERAIYILSIIYSVCFILALIVYPNRLFLGYGEVEKAIDTSRGFPRIRLTLIGLAPIFFTYFYSLSLLKVRKSKKAIFLVVSMYVLIILQLGRTPIVLTTFLGLWYLTNNVNFFKKIIIASSVCLFLWVVYENVSVVSDLVDYSLNDYERSSEEENIRIGSYRFYMTEVSNDWYTQFFGNGQYSLGKSRFGDFVDRFGRSNGYIPADVGYAYIYLNFGVLGIFVFVLLLIKSLTIKIDKRYSYIKYYMIFLFLVNFTGNAILGGLPFVILSLYIIDKAKINKHGEINISNQS